MSDIIRVHPGFIGESGDPFTFDDDDRDQAEAELGRFMEGLIDAHIESGKQGGGFVWQSAAGIIGARAFGMASQVIPKEQFPGNCDPAKGPTTSPAEALFRAAFVSGLTRASIGFALVGGVEAGGVKEGKAKLDGLAEAPPDDSVLQLVGVAWCPTGATASVVVVVPYNFKLGTRGPAVVVSGEDAGISSLIHPVNAGIKAARETR